MIRKNRGMNKQEILEQLRRSILEIKYIKNNGEMRYATATLNPEIITDDLAHGEELEYTRYNNTYNEDLDDPHVVYYDLEKHEFRIFFIDRVTVLSSTKFIPVRPPKVKILSIEPVEFSEEEFIALGPKALEAYKYLETLGFSQENVGVSPYHASEKVMRMLAVSDDKIGLELEIYQAKKIKDLSIETKAYGIGLEYDGSLSSEGVELVTPVVDYTKIGAFVKVFKRLNQQYASTKDKAEAAQKAGIHIHFDLDTLIKRKFLTAWFIMNGFCLPEPLQRRIGDFSLPLVRKWKNNYFNIDSLEKYKEFILVQDNHSHDLNATIRPYGIEFRGISSIEIENLEIHLRVLHEIKEIVNKTFDNTSLDIAMTETQRMERFQIANEKLKKYLREVKRQYQLFES